MDTDGGKRPWRQYRYGPRFRRWGRLSFSSLLAGYQQWKKFLVSRSFAGGSNRDAQRLRFGRKITFGGHSGGYGRLRISGQYHASHDACVLREARRVGTSNRRRLGQRLSQSRGPGALGRTAIRRYLPRTRRRRHHSSDLGCARHLYPRVCSGSRELRPRQDFRYPGGIANLRRIPEKRDLRLSFHFGFEILRGMQRIALPRLHRSLRRLCHYRQRRRERSYGEQNGQCLSRGGCGGRRQQR